MEGLVKRLWMLVGVLALGAAVVAFTQKPEGAKPTERWMEDHLPEKVGSYAFLPGKENPRQSYKMDDKSYKELKPFGIVARMFSGDAKSFEAVVIASDNKESFHDPRWCFGAQGFNFVELGDELVDTETRGKVPVKVVSVTMPGRETRIAAYTYQGPGGFYASMQKLKMAMIIEPLKGGTNLDGVFYRFLPQYTEATKEDLLIFIKGFLDEAYRRSDGYF